MVKDRLKLSDREVQFFPRCFLFGHYDSRGGATLIPAKHLIEAFEIYSTTMGWSKVDGQLEDLGMKEHFAQITKPQEGMYNDYETWKPDSIHSLMEEDFMFSCSVVICDEKINEEEAELDAKYSEESGYKYGLVQYRWLSNHHLEDETKKNELSPWSDISQDCSKTLIFWRGNKPVIEPKVLQMDYLPGLEVRIIRKNYGEDACGVVWMKEGI